MENFITNALLHRKWPIHKFEIYVPFKWCNPDVNEWILCLSRNDVRELILHMGERCCYTWEQLVRSSIYSCEKLTDLKLAYCKLDPPPSTFKGFLFLKCLCLEDVDLSTGGIECLVANSPLLERFDLLESTETKNEELRIRSTNLKYLYVMCYGELCVSAPLLAEISIEFFDHYLKSYHRSVLEHGSVCNYTDFRGGFSNLQKLRGSVNFTKYLSLGIEFCHQTLIFHQLKDIKLVDVQFGDIKEVSVVAHLIVGSPNLQKLKIEADYCGEGADESEAPPLCFGDFGCAPKFTLEKLSVVELCGDIDRYLPLEMEFIRSLLERSPVLKMMNLGYISTKKKQKLAHELLGFSRASPNVKLSYRKVS